MRHGFRSVDERLNAGQPGLRERSQDPFRVADFGGWQRAKKEIVDGIWKRRVMQEVGQVIGQRRRPAPRAAVPVRAPRAWSCCR